MGFGLYASAIGIGSVFAALLAVAVLSEALKRMAGGAERPSEEVTDKRKVAAVAAALASVEMFPVAGNKAETSGDGDRWTVAARMESLNRGTEGDG